MKKLLITSAFIFSGFLSSQAHSQPHEACLNNNNGAMNKNMCMQLCKNHFFEQYGKDKYNRDKVKADWKKVDANQCPSTASCACNYQ